MKNTKKQKAKQKAVDAIDQIVAGAKELEQAERAYYGRPEPPDIEKTLSAFRQSGLCFARAM